MAAPVADKILLPVDTGNLGKKVRTQTRLVGGDTVHEHFFVQTREAKVVSVFRLALAQATVLAAAQNGTGTGFLYGFLAAAQSTRALRLRRLSISTQHSTVLATPTAPRLLLRKITANNDLTTTLLTPTVNDSVLHSAPVSKFSAVVTGLSAVAFVGDGIGSAAIAGALTAVGAYEPCIKDIVDPAADEDDWPVFRPGQGFVLYQDTAGTTSDTRKLNIQLLADEIDIA